MRGFEERGRILYEYTWENGQFQVFPAEKIWHVKGLSTDGLVGLSPIGMARESIGLAFIVYPKAISSLPAFSREFGLIFFGILGTKPFLKKKILLMLMLKREFMILLSLCLMEKEKIVA